MRDKILAILVVFCLFSSGNAGALTFDEKTPAEDIAALKESLRQEIGSFDLASCQLILVPLYDLEVQEFLRFLEINFQNKSANSSLSNIAIARYSELKQALDSHFLELTPGVGDNRANVGVSELDSYTNCAQVKNAYLDLAKERMIQHIRNTSAQKQTTIMLEKYQAINVKMRDLHLQGSKMYGLLRTFKEKLPGFIAYCLTN